VASSSRRVSSCDIRGCVMGTDFLEGGVVGNESCEGRGEGGEGKTRQRRVS